VLDVSDVNRAIADGTIKVEKVAPAYAAAVLGADPLPQKPIDVSASSYSASWTQKRAGKSRRGIARRKPGAERLKIRACYQERPGLSTAEIATSTGIAVSLVASKLSSDSAADLCYADFSKKPARWYPCVKRQR